MTREEKARIKEEELKEEQKELRKKKLIKNIVISIIIFFILIFVSLYYMRFYEVKRLVVKEIKIEDKLITDKFNGFKIAHISDIHYMMTTDKKDLEKIVKKINSLKPDILVFTGDLLDSEVNYKESDYETLEKVLSDIDVSMSKYYIKGNHDYDFDNDVEIILENSGFTSLNNKEDLIYKTDTDYIKIKGYGSSIKNDFNYQENNDNIYTISLIHEGDNSDNIKDSNLILAGHSHNLQINIPYIKTLFKVEGSKKYYDNYYNLGNTKLYINSGIGTSGYKLRLFNPPTINFYRLVNK